MSEDVYRLVRDVFSPDKVLVRLAGAIEWVVEKALSDSVQFTMIALIALILLCTFYTCTFMGDLAVSRYYGWAPIYMQPRWTEEKKRVVRNTDHMLDPGSPHHRHIIRETRQHERVYDHVSKATHVTASFDPTEDVGNLIISANQRLLYTVEPSFRSPTVATCPLAQQARLEQQVLDLDVSKHALPWANADEEKNAGAAGGQDGAAGKRLLMGRKNPVRYEEYLKLTSGGAMAQQHEDAYRKHSLRMKEVDVKRIAREQAFGSLTTHKEATADLNLKSKHMFSEGMEPSGTAPDGTPEDPTAGSSGDLTQ